jgi:curved DNA-binding protein CbpA
MNEKYACWSCEQERPLEQHPVVCESCGKVQRIPPGASPFALLGFEAESFGISFEEVETRWLKRSRKCHPDRYAMRDAQERRYALEQMAAANDAFKTLSQVIARGAYLMQARGLPPDAMPDELFLMDMMEAQEAASSPGPDHLPMKSDFEKRFSEDQAQLEQIFDHASESTDEAPLLLTRLRYYRRVLDALEGRGPEI